MKTETVVLKSYLGEVLDVDKENFLARITEKTTNEVSELFISKDQVFSGSHSLILPGVSFVWEVGWTGDNQKRIPFSVIRFTPFTS